MDDDASIAVVEALLVALLVTGAILFVNLRQTPAPPQPASAASDEASDLLRILQAGTYNGVDFETAIARIAESSGPPSSPPAAPAELVDMDTLIHLVKPDGGYQLRLNNGFASLYLAGSTAYDPNSARSASVPYAGDQPGWAVGDPAFAFTITQDLVPGGTHGSDGTQPTLNGIVTGNPPAPAAYDCVKSPMGSTTAPDGTDWVTEWKTSGGGNTVPEDAAFGLWEFHDDDPMIPTPCNQTPRVVCGDAMGVDHPPYYPDPAYTNPTASPAGTNLAASCTAWCGPVRDFIVGSPTYPTYPASPFPSSSYTWHVGAPCNDEICDATTATDETYRDNYPYGLSGTACQAGCDPDFNSVAGSEFPALPQPYASYYSWQRGPTGSTCPDSMCDASSPFTDNTFVDNIPYGLDIYPPGAGPEDGCRATCGTHDWNHGLSSDGGATASPTTGQTTNAGSFAATWIGYDTWSAGNPCSDVVCDTGTVAGKYTDHAPFGLNGPAPAGSCRNSCSAHDWYNGPATTDAGIAFTPAGYTGTDISGQTSYARTVATYSTWHAGAPCSDILCDTDSAGTAPYIDYPNFGLDGGATGNCQPGCNQAGSPTTCIPFVFPTVAEYKITEGSVRTENKVTETTPPTPETRVTETLTPETKISETSTTPTNGAIAETKGISGGPATARVDVDRDGSIITERPVYRLELVVWDA